MKRLPIWLALFVAVALLSSSAAFGSAPKGFWTTSACEHTLTKKGFSYLIRTPAGHGFYLSQAVCIGIPKTALCDGSSNTRYSTFTVYGRSPLGGIVRSFTLDAKAGRGVPISLRSSDPPLFTVLNVTLVNGEMSPAGFRASTGLIVQQLGRQNATSCAGAGTS